MSAKKVETYTASTKSGSKAAHAKAGDMHAIALKDIRVFLVPDGEAWYAQALELDYAAGGNSIEEAKTNFEEGLIATICEYLKYYGSIEKFLKPAPPEDWQEYYQTPANQLHLYSSVAAVELLRLGRKPGRLQAEELPFTSLMFFSKEKQAAMAEVGA